jgi:hypothetical protein
VDELKYWLGMSSPDELVKAGARIQACVENMFSLGKHYFIESQSWYKEPTNSISITAPDPWPSKYPVQFL